MGSGDLTASPRRLRSGRLFERALRAQPLVPERLRCWVVVMTLTATACLLGLGFGGRNSPRPVLFDQSVDSYFVRTPVLAHRVAIVLSHIGEPKIFLILTAVAAVLLILVGDRRAAVAAAGSVGISAVLVERVLKPFFGQYTGFPGPSFPSGHAAVAAALAGTLILAAGGNRPLGRLMGSPLRYLLMTLVLIVSFAVGPAMVVLQDHYASDVVAGAPLGLAVAGCTALFLDAVARCWAAWHDRPPDHPSIRPR
jgi:membrane-associated phospholipid phosphatase